MIHPFKGPFDHKTCQSLSDCYRNMETELPEDPVVHDKEGLGLFCSLFATAAGRLYTSATFRGPAAHCAL